MYNSASMNFLHVLDAVPSRALDNEEFMKLSNFYNRIRQSVRHEVL